MNLELTEKIVDEAWDNGILKKIEDADYHGIVDGMAKINIVRDNQIIYTFRISLENSDIHVDIPNVEDTIVYKCDVESFGKEAGTLGVDQHTILEIINMLIILYNELRANANLRVI